MGGIIRRPFFYLFLQQPLALQALKFYRLALPWKLAVIWLFWDYLATFSAQSVSDAPNEHQQPLMSVKPAHGRVGRPRFFNMPVIVLELRLI